MKKRDFVDTEGSIVVPKVSVKYEPKVVVDAERVFVGETITLPEVVVDYLTTAELRIFKHIYQHIRQHGHCITRLASIAKEIDATPQAAHQTLNNLMQLGFVYTEKYGRKAEKFISFETLGKLDEYNKALKPGALMFMRRKYGTRSISSLVASAEVRAEVMARYEDRPFDPIEDEEYG